MKNTQLEKQTIDTMTTHQKEMLRNLATLGISMAGALIARSVVSKIRYRTQQTATPVHQASWPEAITWTIAMSLTAGFTRMLLKRYSQQKLPHQV